jgi:hypothetical protein
MDGEKNKCKKTTDWSQTNLVNAASLKAADLESISGCEGMPEVTAPASQRCCSSRHFSIASRGTVEALDPQSPPRMPSLHLNATM